MVAVTSTCFIVGEQTYAVGNINSVKPTEIPGDLTTHTFALRIAMIVVLAAIASHSFLFALAGVIIVAVAFIGSRGIKPTHAVVLTSAGRETQTITHENRAFVYSIVSALNEAIMARR